MADITRYLVQARMSGEASTDILHRPIFDVNMRLFRDSGNYKSIVLSAIAYMSFVAKKEFKNYAPIQGISGANVGIPFNIVGIRSAKQFRPDSNSIVLKDSMWFLINPKIISKSPETKVVESNCGSVRLSEKIKVRRHVWIKVEYYSEAGRKIRTRVEGVMACTLQHEMDHNCGILITDKEEKKENE
jgi:peptide deformylase